MTLALILLQILLYNKIFNLCLDVGLSKPNHIPSASYFFKNNPQSLLHVGLQGEVIFLKVFMYPLHESLLYLLGNLLQQFLENSM